ncbi:membrane protease subunit [bacterium]|jgi:regulator of protease activity HflC (stomatin/prohibitin superfamily)|nr:membrane protease subunit [bacterium]
MKNITLLTIAGVAVLAFILWGAPQLGVYNRTLAGKASLMEAESTRQVKVLEAKAKMDAASLEARAEIERAKGVAEANRIIGDSLKDNPRYLQYLYIVGLQEGSEKGNRTIYVPTEGGLPVPTLGIDK